MFSFFLGSRAAAINLEARSITSENLIRRCAIVRGTDLNIDVLLTAIKNGLSGLLILIPQNLEKLPENITDVSIKKRKTWSYL